MTTANEAQRLKRWKEAEYIHRHLERQNRRGSMENAFNRIGYRFISRNNFIISVMDEYGVNTSNNLEYHLKTFYDTFVDSNCQRVDSRCILCTYWSILFRESIAKSTRRVFDNFCNLYIREDSKCISFKETVEILTIGCISYYDIVNCSNKLLSSLQALNITNNEGIMISICTIRRILESTPSLLIMFRDQILLRLSTDERLRLHMAHEEECIDRFDASAKRLVKRRVVLKLNVMFVVLSAWWVYTQESSRSRLVAMRMMYWKAKKIIDGWKRRVIRSKYLKNMCIHLNVLHELIKVRKSFKLWGLNQKIDKACFLQSDAYKSKMLGLTLLRIALMKLLKKKMLQSWIEELKVQRRIELSVEYRCYVTLKATFVTWKLHAHQKILKRKGVDHRRWAEATIQTLVISCIEQDKENGEMEDEDETIIKQHDRERDTTRNKMNQMRKAMTGALDSKIIALQNEARRKRCEQDKNDFISTLDERWYDIETVEVNKALKKTTIWLKTKEGKNEIEKFLKRIGIELQSPAADLCNHALINSSILDGKLASVGILSDIFYEKLLLLGDNDLIHRDSFECYLTKIGINLTSSQMRSFVVDRGAHNKNQYINIFHLRKQIEKTYKYFGVEGSRYKRFVNVCHGILGFYDVETNEMVLEHDMTKKKMRQVSMDNFMAQEVVQIKRQIAAEKKLDLSRLRREHSASRIQRIWRARKQLSKTRMRILLNKR